MLPYYEKKDNDIHVRRSKRIGCAKHLHGHIELAIMLKGRTLAYADNNGGILCEAHAFISFPNQVHYFSDDFGDCDNVLFIFPSNKISAFNRIFSKKLPLQSIVGIDLEKILPIINIALDAEQNKGAFYETIVENALSIILAHIFERMKLEDVKKRNISAIQSILLYCSEHYNEDITLEKIAENTHMSKYYISHIFSKEIGISMPEYINTLRIRDAEMLLQKGDMSITDVAFAVGFNSLRSFNRHFFAQTGKTPRQIRNSDKNE
ncbi:MAG: helix-turn-helix transcriptional regulator [Ruminococcaceae bacterium]|nr:helix-turn-helix transcriptional regulator [Oscillospiraceae bacterium]